MAILPLQLARVSNLLRTSVATQSIASTQQQLLEVQNQLSTGKRLNAPSDDPGSAAIAEQLRILTQEQPEVTLHTVLDDAYPTNLREIYNRPPFLFVRGELAPEDENIIQDSLHGVSDVQDFMERTSHVLSLISRNVGVAVAASGPKNALEHVYFSRLGDQKVLAVVVTKSGLVRDRVLRMDLPQSELDAAARFINENFRGWTLESVRTEIARRLEQERSEYDRLMSSIEQLYKQGALAGADSEHVVFIEGASNLVASEQDRNRLQELLQALEEKQKVVSLLSAYLDVKQEAVRVVIGLDEAQPSLRNFVLIGTPARVGDEVMGSLAVLGPPRMDYEHTITAVSYIARMFDRILNENE